MGNKLFANFGVDIAATINQELGDAVLPMVLVKKTTGTRTVTDLSGGTNDSSRNHACRGIISRSSKKQQGRTVTVETVDEALILGDSLPSGVVPEPDDELVAEGNRYNISGTPKRDPDAATYTCKLRGGR